MYRRNLFTYDGSQTDADWPAFAGDKCLTDASVRGMSVLDLSGYGLCFHGSSTTVDILPRVVLHLR
jgi:hypothetical protein